MSPYIFIRLLVLSIPLIPVLAWAADPVPVPPSSTWQNVAALLINGLGTLVITHFATKYVVPVIREQAPWLTPSAVAPAVGVGLVMIQNWLGARGILGVDLSPVMGIFAGATATAIHQTFRAREEKTARAVTKLAPARWFFRRARV